MHEIVNEPRGVRSHGKTSARILVCVPRYLPGYKSGGPVRAIANMVASLGEQLEFFIVTRDRDATDTATYAGVVPNEWCNVGNAQVLYCSSITFCRLRQAVRHARPDLIHLNSFQDRFTRSMMILRHFGLLGRTPILLAPRGEFSPGAMEIKRCKKDLYRTGARWICLHEQIHWQVSSALERGHLLAAEPARRLDSHSIHVTTEINDGARFSSPHPAKGSGSVRFVFISRISEKKNLQFLLDLLAKIKGKVELDIFGPVAPGDHAYWERCRASIARLPANIIIRYRGALDHSVVPQVLHEYHFFTLPTKGENYCHAAVESFVNGTPAILSNETPWQRLRESRAGFDIPLEDAKQWIDVLQMCVNMDSTSYSEYSRGALDYSRRFSRHDAVQQHVEMFKALLGRSF